MLEIEMKFPVEQFDPIEKQLREWGLEPAERRLERDQYFNAPDRDFGRTDEALRLRQVGPTNVLTYKGPKLETRAKTRTEIEVPVGEGEAHAEALRQVLVHLGYRPVAVVEKGRVCYHRRQGPFLLEITLDDVKDVGRFVEIEIIAPADQLADAQEVLGRTAASLGLQHSERRSYLEMLLAGKP